jgi:hypothetical protein
MYKSALLASLTRENIEKMFEYFTEEKELLNLGFNAHLGRFEDACPARLYLKPIGNNEACISTELIGIFKGTKLPDPTTRLAGFGQTQNHWFMTVRQPKHLRTGIPIARFADFKTRASIRNDFQGVREVEDPEPK